MLMQYGYKYNLCSIQNDKENTYAYVKAIHIDISCSLKCIKVKQK